MSPSWHPVLPPDVVEWIVEFTPEWVGALLVPITYIGSVFVVAPLVVVAYLWAPRRLGIAMPAFFAYYGVMGGIKSMNSAVRPDVPAPVGESVFPAAYSSWYGHATSIGSTSFPSGNAMVTAVIVTLLVVELRISTFLRRAAVGVAVIAVVGYTRLGLGVHYPVDVIGGIALGVGLAGAFLLVRWLVAERIENGRWRSYDLTVAFALAAVLAFVGLWLRSNGFGVPTFDGVQGSNRVLAFGGAVGGMIAWTAVQRVGHRVTSPGTKVLSTACLLGVVTIAYAIHMNVTHVLITIVWAAVVFGTIVAMPFTAPRRGDLTAWIQDHSQRESSHA